MSVPLLFLLLEEEGGSGAGINAQLGSFVFQTGLDNVEPQSDSDWNREPSVQITRARGSAKDTILRLAMGSFTRSFSVWTTPERFRILRTMVSTLQTFVDWDGETRIVFVQTVHRQVGRPFRCKVDIELIEQ